MQKLLILKVFISCPDDVSDEKQAIIQYIEDNNNKFEKDYQIQLNPKDWMKHSRRGPGRPEGHTIELVDECHIYIGMMATKFGTKTNLAGSGTQEEYIRAYHRWEKAQLPEMLFYFKDPSFETRPPLDTLKELTKIAEFENDIKDNDFVDKFTDTYDLITKINYQLDLILKNWRTNHPKSIVSGTDVSGKEEEIDILSEYQKFLIDQYDTVTIFKDKSFRLKDIYVSLRLEINPQMWHEMGDTEFVRKLKDGTLPDRYHEVMGTMNERSLKQGRDALHKGSTGDTLIIDDVLNASDRAVILGEAGSGKTTLFHHLIANYHNFTKKYIPVYLPIRYWLKCELCDPIHAFCMMLNEDYFPFPSRYTNTLKENLNQYWQENNILLLLDGLDEIDQEALNQVCTRLNGLEANSNKVLVSCRRTSYDHQLKGDSWWIYSINPFSEQDRMNYMRNYFRQDATIATKLSGLVEYRPRLKSLAQNPLLMGLICYIFEEGDRKLPEERVVLYERCVDELLKRRENQKFEHYNEFKKAFLTHLAYHFFTVQDKKKREWFPKSEVFKLAIDFRNEQRNHDNLAVPEEEKIDEFIKELSDINSLLQPVAANSYCFPHRSFQEYFAANYLNQATKGFQLITEKLCEDDFWTETICLYAGMQTNATDLINALGKKGKIGLILKLIPDTVRIDWGDLDKKTLNWKIRRCAVEQLVLPEVDPGTKDERADVLRGILCGAQPDPNANVRYSALIALERIGTPTALEIVKKQHIIPPDVIINAMPYEYKAHGHVIKINQAGMPPNMVFIKGGSYVMGEIKKKVSVDDLYMSIFPVTNREYRRFVEEGGYDRKEFWTKEGWKYCKKEKWRKPRWWDDAQFNHAWQPVVGVSWYEAEAYCAWYTKFLRVKNPVRLPTEEEWEYAARGSRGSEWSFGDWNENVPRWDSYLDYKNGLAQNTSRVNTVYEKSVNDYGLFDMSGNVWEWTDSFYKEGSSNRVLRGGSWNASAQDCRSAYRYDVDPGFRILDYGFRLVFVPESVGSQSGHTHELNELFERNE